MRLVLAVALSWSVLASAKSPAEKTWVEVDEQFILDAAPSSEAHRRAKVAFDLGEYERAAAEWERAYQELPNPAFLFDRAQALRQARRLEAARSSYAKFWNSHAGMYWLEDYVHGSIAAFMSPPGRAKAPSPPRRVRTDRLGCEPERKELAALVRRAEEAVRSRKSKRAQELFREWQTRTCVCRPGEDDRTKMDAAMARIAPAR